MTKICLIEGCGKKISARNWCAAHYSKWQRHGNPLYVRQFKKDQKCIVDSCERKQEARGYCGTHDMKLRRSGTLEYIRETPEYKNRWLEARVTEVSKIDKIRDPNSRGFLAVNIIGDIRNKARKRQIPWDLENIEAYNLIISKCHYCGLDPKWPIARSGIDRVDNFKGYTKENVVACCYTCNTAKGIKTQVEFKEWVIAISNHFLK